ncbi:hypothetical protein Tco_1104883 [Tanacetum coccineum]
MGHFKIARVAIPCLLMPCECGVMWGFLGVVFCRVAGQRKGWVNSGFGIGGKGGNGYEKEVNKRNDLNKEEVTVKISCDTVVEDVADRDTVIEEVTECMRTPRPTLYEQNETPGGSIYWKPHVNEFHIPGKGPYMIQLMSFRYVYEYAEMDVLKFKKGWSKYKVENNELVAMFWADEVAKCNYKEFGDIVSFDATFNNNNNEKEKVISENSLESQMIEVESQEIHTESHEISLESHGYFLI